MSIEITPENYYIGMWFMELPDRIGNWMACAWRPKDKPGPWTLRWRFRYYEDEKIFDSEDRRSWYTMEIKDATEEKVVESLEYVATMMCGVTGTTLTFWEIRGDGDKAMDKMKTHPPPWMHAQHMSEEEAAKKGYIPPKKEGE